MRHDEYLRGQASPRTGIGFGQLELTAAERNDLISFSGTPARAAVTKLLQIMLIEARDEAVNADPSKPAERLAALDLATATAKVLTKLEDKIIFIVGEHLGALQQQMAEQDLQDQLRMEEIVLNPINSGH